MAVLRYAPVGQVTCRRKGVADLASAEAKPGCQRRRVSIAAMHKIAVEGYLP